MQWQSRSKGHFLKDKCKLPWMQFKCLEEIMMIIKICEIELGRYFSLFFEAV